MAMETHQLENPQSDELVVSSMFFFYEITPNPTWPNDETFHSCCSNGLVQPPNKKNTCHIFGGLAWGELSPPVYIFFFRVADVGCWMFFFFGGLRYF